MLLLLMLDLVPIIGCFYDLLSDTLIVLVSDALSLCLECSFGCFDFEEILLFRWGSGMFLLPEIIRVVIIILLPKHLTTERSHQRKHNWSKRRCERIKSIYVSIDLAIFFLSGSHPLIILKFLLELSLLPSQICVLYLFLFLLHWGSYLLAFFLYLSQLLSQPTVFLWPEYTQNYKML